jgi:aminoglycoside 2''-phosphotransferase
MPLKKSWKENVMMHRIAMVIVGISGLISIPNNAHAVNKEQSGKFNERILTHHDEASVRHVIIDEIPDLTIHSLKLISTGWDNLVADVNNEWIFRFAREKSFVIALERERLLLDKLHQHISIPIPYYEFFGINTAFVGYRKIPGESLLDEALYLTLPNYVRQEIAETLAHFLTQLHKAVSVDEALRWGYQKYEVPLESIETCVVGTTQSSQAERLISEALIYSKQHFACEEENFVLLHNDLHDGNFTFDLDTQKVIGIFDFSDAAIGNYFIEFAQLFNIHHDLAFRTMEAYMRLNKIDNEINNAIKPAAVEYILRRARYILQAREQGNGAREQRLIQQLERFAPAWDDLCGQISTIINL